MANKLSIDIQMNSQGYVRGAQEAANSTKKLTDTTQEYIESFGPLKKEMHAANKEAENLALRYVMLSKEEKESEFGKQLAADLDFAIDKAAELKDIFGDVRDEINARASDTAGWDAIKESLDICKDAMTAYAGVVAKLTGDEKALKDLTANLSIIYGGFGTVIKTVNALQRQSKTMNGVLIAQRQLSKLAIAAEKSELVGATVAQKAFNLAAKANPYVFLASVVLTTVAAVTAYTLATKKATEEEKKHQEELKKTTERWQDNEKQIKGSVGEVIGKYMMLKSEWESLSSEHERAKWVKENKSKFDDLGIAVKNVKDAENIFINNTGSVVEALQSRAMAAAQWEVLVSEIKNYVANGGDVKNLFKEEKNDLDNITAALIGQQKQVKTLDDMYKNVDWNNDIAPIDNIQAPNQQTLEPVKLQTDESRIKDYFNAYIESSKKATEASKVLGDTNVNKSKKQLTYLQKLQENVSIFQKQLENIDPSLSNSSELVEKARANLKTAQETLKNYRLFIGLDIEKPKSILEKLEDELKKAEAELPFAISEEDVEAAQKKIKDLKDKIKEEKIRLKIEVDVEAEKLKADLQSISDIVKEALQKDISPKWNFDGLKDDAKDAANETVKQIERIEKAIEKLKKIKNPKLAGQTKEQIDTLENQKDALLESAEAFNKAAKEAREHQAQLELSKQSYDMMINSVSSIGSALKDLGAEEAGAAIQFVASSAQMIAQCIQNIAALQAQAIAAGTASGAALPFPANLAAIASIIATITAIFASLAKFENGGVIGGNSFTGDRLLIRANSGERVLTAEQNENFEKIASAIVGNGLVSNQTVYVQGRIKGTDILLVSKNANKILSKSGTNISF